MRKFAVILVVGAGLVWAAPASADQSQAGCQAYGQFIAGAAQAGVVGGIVSGVATSGPGAVADLSASLRQGTCSSS